MSYRIVTTKPWRYRDPKRGVRVLEPGVYDVPKDLPERIGQLCVDQGMARKLTPPATPREEDRAKLVKGIVAPRKRGRPRKTPAPENKALHVAEDK